jgi:sugar phosphate isomerase/epimerase
MPIYVSTACLPGDVPLAQRLREYASLGLLHVELGAGVSAPTVQWRESDFPFGQQYLVHNYFPTPIDPFVLNLASEQSRNRQRSIEFVIGALELSSRVSAPFYSVHGGFVTDPTGFANGGFIFPLPRSSEESRLAMERFVAAIEAVLKRAEELGLQLLVENNVCIPENKGKLLLQTAEEFEGLFRRCHSDNLGMLLDTGHLNVTASTFGFDRMEFVERLAPFVRAFHVHDNDGTRDRHDPIEPGSWVTTVVKRPEFNHCPVILESKFQNVEAVHQHVSWLQTELRRN